VQFQAISDLSVAVFCVHEAQSVFFFYLYGCCSQSVALYTWENDYNYRAKVAAQHFIALMLTNQLIMLNTNQQQQ